MSEPISTPPPAPAGVSRTTLILSLALAITTTAAFVFGVLYFTQPRADAPHVQRGTVAPKGTFMGDVVYPIAYRSKPNLNLRSSRRTFEITRQDEKGFSWTARALVEDVKDDKGYGAERMARQYPLWYLVNEGYTGGTTPEVEDFTWEAQGLPATHAP